MRRPRRSRSSRAEADGITVIVSRLARGVHPFTAGHDHLSHRIAARGLLDLLGRALEDD